MDVRKPVGVPCMRLLRTSILLLAALVPVAPTPLRAQQPEQLYTATRQQLDVTKVLLAQEDAWNKGDLDGYLSHYKDATDTEAQLAGPVRGLNNIRSAFRMNFPNKEAMGHLEQLEVAVRALGDTYAIATGKYHLTRSKKAGGDVDGTFSYVFEKTAAGWQIIFSVTT